ncbi:MAG: chromosome partitioning protein ParA [Pseudomonadales bacterium GWC1_66_9]|nr:MAG: chromosome partitioning protein ParA [Pseudomonadales bacterium GWC1_66_9]
MKSNPDTSIASRRPLPRLALLTLGGLLLAGCAGNPPTEQFALTESSVREAVSAGGTQYAPVEMRAAREKWREAELAMQKKDYDRARLLAEQAEWDARVAGRKARATKAQRAVEDMKKGVQDLREEGMRSVQ